MSKRKIGVMIESFRLGVKGGIKKAAQLGADGFQIYVIEGEMLASNMNAAARRDFRRFVADEGLVISALCADFGHGFLDEARNRDLVGKTQDAMDQAADLGTAVVTSHIGKLPQDENDPQWLAARRAVTEIARHGEKIGVAFASETGPESPEHLLKFLKQIPYSAAKVNYDPANFCMFGFDQIAGVSVLKDYIVHTHAKDGLRNQLLEVALGQGGVDFPRYIKELDAIGYDGFLTIEREVGPDPVKDISAAVEFLRQL